MSGLPDVRTAGPGYFALSAARSRFPKPPALFPTVALSPMNLST